VTLKSEGDTKEGTEKRPDDESGALRFVAAWHAKG
jgi:hypothetical protein